jgi:hypothetical protein
VHFKVRQKVAVVQVIAIKEGQIKTLCLMSTTPTVPIPWEPQPQETTGTYRFDGRFVATATVINDLGNDVVRALYFIAQGLVKEHDGIDYILSFKHRETDQEVWLIDQLNDEMKASESPAWVEEYNTCTLCYPHER